MQSWTGLCSPRLHIELQTCARLRQTASDCARLRQTARHKMANRTSQAVRQAALAALSDDDREATAVIALRDLDVQLS